MTTVVISKDRSGYKTCECGPYKWKEEKDNNSECSFQKKKRSSGTRKVHSVLLVTILLCFYKR